MKPFKNIEYNKYNNNLKQTNKMDHYGTSSKSHQSQKQKYKALSTYTVASSVQLNGIIMVTVTPSIEKWLETSCSSKKV